MSPTKFLPSQNAIAKSWAQVDVRRFSSRLCYAMLTKPAFFPQALFFHPISIINPNDPADIARHDCMVSLVTQMLDMNQKLVMENPHT
ncbi:MAG: hypothetical protein Q7U51_10745 [Methanoregula sp.]|nr:hypothetical protein [Methanoregula sp.]